MPHAGFRVGVRRVKTVSVFPPLRDDFNRADSASSMGVVPSGPTWTPLLGTWGIASNQAYLSATHGNFDNVVGIDLGASDATVQVTLATISQATCLAVRIQDSTHYLIFHNNGTVYNGNGFSTVFSGAGAFAAGDVMTVKASGTNYKWYRNGSLVGQFTSALYSTATKFGLYSESTGNRFDNFGYSTP